MSQPSPSGSGIPHRVIWIDVCRIIAFFYIALSHCCVTSCEYAPAVRGGVALFFVISAYFCANKPIKDILKRVVILLACIWFWHTVTQLVILRSINGYQNPLGMLRTLSYLWFLRDLAVCMLVSLLVRRLNPAGQLILIIVLVSCLSDWMECNPPQSTLFSLIFFNIGIALKRMAPNNLSDFLFPYIGKISGRSLNILLAVITLASVPLFAFSAKSVSPVPVSCFVVMALISLSAVFLEQSMPKACCFRSYLLLLAQAGFFFYASHCALLRAFVSVYIKMTGSFPGTLPCVISIAVYFSACAAIVKALAHRNRYLDIILLAR